jgi:biopolymer transport protein ExbD
MAQVTSSRQNGRKPLTTINVTPLVDVLLILLVILMLAMPLFVKRLPVSMPETKLDAPPVAAKTMRVALGPNMAYFLEDAKTSLNDVLNHVGEGATVEVYVDQAVSYKELTAFTDALYSKFPKDVILMSR